MNRIEHIVLFALVTLGLPIVSVAEVSFVRQIAPILNVRCIGCHGERTNLGRYRAQTFRNLMMTGTSGKAPIIAGKPDESKLYQLISTHSVQDRMPKGDDSLSNEQLSTFRKWISEGAKFDGSDQNASLKTLLGARVHPASPGVYSAPVPIMAIAFSPNGSQIFSSGYHEVLVWDAISGRLMQRIDRLPERIQAIQFSPDGSRLLVAGGMPGEYGEVFIINSADTSKRILLGRFNDIVLSAVFSHDGKNVVAGGADMNVRCFSTESGKQVWSTKVHSDTVNAVAISDDGEFVVSASKDMTVKVMRAHDGELYTTYSGHNRQLGEYRGSSPVYSIGFLPGTHLAYSGGGGRWIQIWDPVQAKAESGDAGDMEERFAKQGTTRYLEHKLDKDILKLVLSPTRVFISSANGLVREYDISSMQEVRQYDPLNDWAFGLAFHQSTQRLAAGSFRGQIKIWDANTGRELISFIGCPSVKSPKRKKY